MITKTAGKIIYAQINTTFHLSGRSKTSTKVKKTMRKRWRNG